MKKFNPMKEQTKNILLSISRTLKSKKVTFVENRIGPEGDTYTTMYSLDLDGVMGQIIVDVCPDGIEIFLNDDVDELCYDVTIFVEEGQSSVSVDVGLLVDFLKRKKKAEKKITKLLREVRSLCEVNGIDPECYLVGGFVF